MKIHGFQEKMKDKGNQFSIVIQNCVLMITRSF